MSKHLEHKHISRNGGKPYYLQFHIKPWMRNFLPLEYRNRKNIKESLRTSHLPTALKRLNERINALGFIIDPHSEELLPHPDKLAKSDSSRFSESDKKPEEAYHHARNTAATLTTNEIEKVLEVESSVFHEQIETLYNEDRTKAQVFEQLYNARIDGYERALSGEDAKFNPAPHKYEITLRYAAKLLMRDYEEAGKTNKQIGRVKISVEKFLSFLQQTDVQLTSIAIRHVKKYIRQSAYNNIPLNTFSAELGILDKVFKFAQEEGFVNDNAHNPFLGHRPLKGFKAAETKAIYEPEHVEQLALEAIKHHRFDILTTVAVSYYTGMRCSELFQCVLVCEDGITCFDIREAKTIASIRKVPLHDHLESWLAHNNLLPNFEKPFDWSATSVDAFNKRFNRFNKTYFLQKYSPNTKGALSHHSFRHGMATRLHRLQLSELEVASVVGHSRDTVAQTTSGRVYIAEEEIKKIQTWINKITPIELPNIPKHLLPVQV